MVLGTAYLLRGAIAPGIQQGFVSRCPTVAGITANLPLATRNRAASILVITLGTVYYTWVKAVETAPRAQPRDKDIEANSSLMKESDTALEEDAMELQNHSEKIDRD